jgi:putative hydrolase of the HAD superfamily
MAIGMPANLTTIGFDADDTLWHNMRFYALTQGRFTALLADYADTALLGERLLAAERRNLGIYGYGIKGFTLSMIETAIEITDGRVPAHVLKQVLEAGREMLSHPIEALPFAHEVLEALAASHTLVLITKGDLFDQERKVAASGLGDYFDGIEIVSDKTALTYDRIFARHGDGPAHSLMVGNSLKSDVVPALHAGSWGVYVPHEHEWGIEQDDEPAQDPRYRRIGNLSELVAVVHEIG